MKNLRIIFIPCAAVLITSLILFNACKKEPASNTNCTTYFPLKPGDTWVYGSPGSLFTLTMLGDTVINNLSYTKATFIDSTGTYNPDVYFFRNSNGSTWALFSNGGSQAFTSAITYGEEMLLVKDNAYMGESWSTIDNKVRTVIETGVSLVIANQTINNVVRIRESDTTTQFSTDYYFAQCVGFIKSNGGLGTGPDTIQRYTLH